MDFVGTGWSTTRAAREAGREAALRSLEGARGAAPRGVLAFGTAGYDQTELLAGIREATGDAPLAGCSTSGILVREGCDEGAHAVAAMSLASERLECAALGAAGLSDARACARALAARVRDSRVQGRLLLLFPDSLTGDVSLLLETLAAELPYPVAVCGGTAGELLQTRRTWQYHGARADSDSVSALLVGGEFVPEIAVSHGCEPIGQEQTITRADGGWIHEIDGRPAWEVYREYLDPTDHESLTMSHFCYLCLAEPLPRPDPRFGSFLVRCPLRLDRRTGALFFPGNLRAGTRVRMALRDPEKTLARALESARGIVARHEGEAPLAVLQFDCCCRGRLLYGARVTERALAPLQGVFGPATPWVGFSTYGEIAALSAGPALFHNYALVLCALYPAAGRGPR